MPKTEALEDLGRTYFVVHVLLCLIWKEQGSCIWAPCKSTDALQEGSIPVTESPFMRLHLLLVWLGNCLWDGSPGGAVSGWSFLQSEWIRSKTQVAADAGEDVEKEE